MITPGAVSKLRNTEDFTDPVALKLSKVEEAGGKLKVSFTDGKENMSGVITSQVVKAHGGALKVDDVVMVLEANVNTVGDAKVLIVADLKVLSAPAAGAPVEGTGEAAQPMQVEPPAVAKQEAAPAEAVAKTPVAKAAMPAAAAAHISPYGGATPAAPMPTPPSAGPAAQGRGRRPVTPIAALNPYNNGWSIRAKVVSKGLKRSFSGRGGAPSSVFTAELVDEQGTAIEATFWREAADRWFDDLEDGKVYVLSRGAVKPANKRYATVRNDYTLHFDNGADIEAAEGDIDTSRMQAKMEFVPIGHLAAYVDKKMTIDLLGVVSSASALGSIKRKTDGSEISRRDLTLVDQSLKTVTLTLWGATAEGAGAEIETLANVGGEAPIIAVSACRVGSYNGVSVSSLQRSHVVINPPALPEAVALRAWWESEGSGAATVHAGAGLATALKGPGAARERLTLSALKESAPSHAEEKPVYATVAATVASVNPEQTMWYMACPENNRKVTEQGPGQYYCEYDGKTYPTMTRRYIMQVKVADVSGESYVQVFNDQAEQLLGSTADELAAMREGGGGAYEAALRRATWTQWVLRLKAQAQEYNGEQRQRLSVAELRPADFVSESRYLLSEIAAAGAPAAA